MHVTYGRERSKTARRATADIVSNSAQRGLDEGRNEPLTAYIITADGKELYAIVQTQIESAKPCAVTEVELGTPTHSYGFNLLRFDRLVLVNRFDWSLTRTPSQAVICQWNIDPS
jgi:hypothetical protein